MAFEFYSKTFLTKNTWTKVLRGSNMTPRKCWNTFSIQFWKSFWFLFEFKKNDFSKSILFAPGKYPIKLGLFFWSFWYIILLYFVFILFSKMIFLRGLFKKRKVLFSWAKSGPIRTESSPSSGQDTHDLQPPPEHRRNNGIRKIPRPLLQDDLLPL